MNNNSSTGQVISCPAFNVIIVAFLLVLASGAQAQQPEAPVKGKFHVYIDDSISLYLNGTES
jgi:hypothetical protein